MMTYTLRSCLPRGQEDEILEAINAGRVVVIAGQGAAEKALIAELIRLRIPYMLSSDVVIVDYAKERPPAAASAKLFRR